jgi:hypothetical protein
MSSPAAAGEWDVASAALALAFRGKKLAKSGFS